MSRKTQRADRPDVVDLVARNKEIAHLFYELNWTRKQLSDRFGLTPTGISGVLRQQARGESPKVRFRGTTKVERRPDSPIFGCPECDGMRSRVVGSTYDDDGSPIRLRVCLDCGKPRPTAEVNIYGTTFSAVDARGRLARNSHRSLSARAVMRSA